MTVWICGEGFFSFWTPRILNDDNDNNIHFSCSCISPHSFMPKLWSFFWLAQIHEKSEYSWNGSFWAHNTSNKLSPNFTVLSKSAVKYRVFYKKKTMFGGQHFLQTISEFYPEGVETKFENIAAQALSTLASLVKHLVYGKKNIDDWIYCLNLSLSSWIVQLIVTDLHSYSVFSL